MAKEEIYRINGKAGLYKGMYPALLASFATEFLWQAIPGLDDVKEDSSIFMWPVLSLGFASVMTVPYPIYTISVRLQMDADRINPLYKGAQHCYEKILATEGWRGLYTGFRITLPYHLATQGFCWFCFAAGVYEIVNPTDK